MEQFLARITPKLNDFKEMSTNREIQSRQEEKTYKAKRKKFRLEFDRLFLTDLRDLIDKSKTLFHENDLNLHVKSYGNSDYGPVMSGDENLIYHVVTINATKPSQYSKSSTCSSCLIFAGDISTSKVQLFQKKVTDPYMNGEFNDLGTLLATYHLAQYDFQTVLSELEKFVTFRLRELEE